MLAQLVEDLVHLVGGGNGLDEDGGTDASARDLQRVLGEQEGVVPQARLEMALELRQVVVGAASAIELLAGIVEEGEAEIGERARQRLPVEDEVLLGKVPAARADEERRDLVVELVGLAFRRGEGELLAEIGRASCRERV